MSRDGAYLHTRPRSPRKFGAGPARAAEAGERSRLLPQERPRGPTCLTPGAFLPPPQCSHSEPASIESWRPCLQRSWPRAQPSPAQAAQQPRTAASPRRRRLSESGSAGRPVLEACRTELCAASRIPPPVDSDAGLFFIGPTTISSGATASAIPATESSAVSFCRCTLRRLTPR